MALAFTTTSTLNITPPSRYINSRGSTTTQMLYSVTLSLPVELVLLGLVILVVGSVGWVVYVRRRRASGGRTRS
jgi:hypothetical protein